MDAPEARETRPVFDRAPLLWLLGPMIVGYTLARTWEPIRPEMTLALALVFAGLAWWFSRASNRRGKVVWATALGSAAILAAWQYASLRQPHPDPVWSTLPIREAQLDLHVERVFDWEDPYGRKAGIAQVKSAPRHLSDLVGQRVGFNLITDEINESVQRGYRGLTRGELIPLFPEGEPANEYEAYLLSQGVHFQLQRGVFLDTIAPAPPFYRWCSDKREQFETLLRAESQKSGEEAASLLVAMALGRKGVLSEEQRDRYVQSGTMHLMAISGLHVGIVAGVFFIVFQLLRFPPAAGAIVGLLLVFLYVQITGGTPSAMRAFLMVAFFWGSRLFRRQASPITCLVDSAVLVLFLYPGQLWQPGFQLSYGVVTAILLYGLPLGNWLQQRFGPDPWQITQKRNRMRLWLENSRRALLQALGVSTSATVASAPLIAAYYGLFTPGAIVLNVILFSLVGLALAGAMLSVSLGLIGGTTISQLINPGPWLFVFAINATVKGAVESVVLFFPLSLSGPAWGPAGTLLVLAACVPCASSTSFVGETRPTGRRLLLPPLALAGFLLIAVTDST